MVDTPREDEPQTPPTGDAGDQPGAPGTGGPGGVLENPGGEDAPIGLRVGRNPGNLGDDVPAAGDVTYPPPASDTTLDM
jgi:hypothetical protein